MFKFTKKNQRGATLLETILVMSLISIIMIGGLNLYNNARVSAQSTEAMREVVGLSTNVRALYASQSDYSGLDNTIVVPAGVAPHGMKTDDTDNTITNAFGGDVTVTEAADAYQFEVEYKDVPKGVCFKVVTADMGQIGVADAATVVEEDDHDDVATPANAALYCTSDTNNLYFLFD